MTKSDLSNSELRVSHRDIPHKMKAAKTEGNLRLFRSLKEEAMEVIKEMKKRGLKTIYTSLNHLSMGFDE